MSADTKPREEMCGNCLKLWAHCDCSRPNRMLVKGDGPLKCDGCGDHTLRRVPGAAMWWCESCKKWREPHLVQCGVHAGDPCTCTSLRAEPREPRNQYPYCACCGYQACVCDVEGWDNLCEALSPQNIPILSDVLAEVARQDELDDLGDDEVARAEIFEDRYHAAVHSTTERYEGRNNYDYTIELAAAALCRAIRLRAEGEQL